MNKNNKNSNKSKSWWLTVFCLVFILECTSAQNDAQTKKVKILPVPALGYSPETGTYVGAVSLFTLDLYNDTLTRTSNAKLEINYTWKKQLILETGWNYFFRNEAWFTNGTVHFSDYPDLYFGIGANTSASNEILLESKRLIANASMLKNLGGKWFLGTLLSYNNYSGVQAEAGETPYPELKNNSNFGIGVSALKDSRNNILTPLNGKYLNVNALYNFAETNYLQLSIDARIYKTWENKSTWSNRLLNKFTTGNPPFYDLALLGGDKYVRGYYYGRFRDNHLTTYQSEFRFPVYKRFYMAAFGGMSNVFSSQNPFLFSNLKPNYGLGIRFLVDKNENTFLRMDVASGGKEHSGFYISFGESF